MPSDLLPDGPFFDALMLYQQAFMIMFLVTFIPTAIAWWRLHEKAGRPGWSGIVPFYNLVILPEIAGAPRWAGVLMMWVMTAIPGSLFLMPQLAKSFGYKPWVGVVSAFFPPLIFWLCGFGSREYQGPAGSREYPNPLLVEN
jgi:hypothetical protein